MDLLCRSFQGTCVSMRRKGRPPVWTPEQRQQVLALAEQGMTQRSIAEQVFGDARCHGRVERILRERGIVREIDPDPSADGPSTDDGFGALDVSVARALVARFERSLAESEEIASLADIERLLRLKRQLDAMETVARVRANARSRNQ